MSSATALASRRPAPRNRWAWTLGGMALALIALAAAWYLLPLEQWLLDFSRWVRGFGPMAGVVYTIVFVIGVLLVVPASVLYILAGLLFGIGGGLVISISAASVGAFLQFLIARYGARAQVQKLIDRRRSFQALDAAVLEEGWKVVLLLRLSPLIPGNAQGWLFGATRISLGTFMWPTVLAIVPWALLFTWIGSAGSAILYRGTDEALGPWQYVLAGAGVAVFSGVVWLIGRRARARLRAMGLNGGKPARAG